MAAQAVMDVARVQAVASSHGRERKVGMSLLLREEPSALSRGVVRNGTDARGGAGTAWRVQGVPA
ncbi:hypothetical protein GCM10010507_41650 [Streptomyces cinnamoneus]|uniref:Uncharacterized protein n=1 Tax=Streptomyces cinnamoneus TaxID=53446 RepID=A0A918TSQ5_STRCJ|nr:hypothetical protein GCM10010507_41650 [Streptomyces cinnamoneus]